MRAKQKQGGASDVWAVVENMATLTGAARFDIWVRDLSTNVGSGHFSDTVFDCMVSIEEQGFNRSCCPALGMHAIVTTITESRMSDEFR